MKATAFSIAAALFLISQPFASAGPEQIQRTDSKAMPEPLVLEKPCTWTGFYIGIHGGYGWGDNSFLELDESDPAYHFHPDGFVGGGQAGFNLQLWFLVLGVEGTFAGTDLGDSDLIDPNGEPSHGHVDTDWIGTIGGRLGVTFWKNRVLLFAKGGAAFTNFDYHTGEVDGNERFHADEDRTVPLLGFGLEYALTCHWSVKLEYNHLFIDSEHVTGIETEGSRRDERTFRADPDLDTFQAGLNFRF